MTIVCSLKILKFNITPAFCMRGNDSLTGKCDNLTVSLYFCLYFLTPSQLFKISPISWQSLDLRQLYKWEKQAYVPMYIKSPQNH